MDNSISRLTHEGIERIFECFAGKKVLVVGDVMVDAYWWGSVNRISPEAPVPIVLVKKKEIRLGGAANVAMNLNRLGAEARVVAVAGKDVEGSQLQQLMMNEGLAAEYLIQSEQRPTTVKTRVIGNNHQLLRVDSEDDVPLSADDRERVAAVVEKALPDVDILIFEDYDKGLLSQQLVEVIIAQARKHKIPVVVDPKRKNFLAYRHSTLFKPNMKELAEGLKIEFSQEFKLAEVAGAAKKLREALSLEMAMITLSEHGVYIQTENEEHHIPAHLREVYDVAGAGDTVSAVAALGLVCGLPPQVIAQLSNLAGGIVCEHPGVVPIEKRQLLEEAKRLLV